MAESALSRLESPSVTLHPAKKPKRFRFSPHFYQILFLNKVEMQDTFYFQSWNQVVRGPSLIFLRLNLVFLVISIVLGFAIPALPYQLWVITGLLVSWLIILYLGKRRGRVLVPLVKTSQGLEELSVIPGYRLTIHLAAICEATRISQASFWLLLALITLSTTYWFEFFPYFILTASLIGTAIATFPLFLARLKRKDMYAVPVSALVKMLPIGMKSYTLPTWFDSVEELDIELRRAMGLPE